MDFENKLKELLKKVKLNEPTISTILGGLVILVVGVLIFNYFKADQSTELTEEIVMEELTSEEEQAGVQILEKETESGTLEAVKVYKVQAEDSLWKIAEKVYQDGYKWVEIAQANNLAFPDYLAVDQELTLPELDVAEPTEEIADEQETEQETMPAIEAEKYVVQEGDNLWEISVRTYQDGYKWPEIAQANNLNNPDCIEVGQELKLPR